MKTVGEDSRFPGSARPWTLWKRPCDRPDRTLTAPCELGVITAPRGQTHAQGHGGDGKRRCGGNLARAALKPVNLTTSRPMASVSFALKRGRRRL